MARCKWCEALGVLALVAGIGYLIFKLEEIKVTNKTAEPKSGRRAVRKNAVKAANSRRGRMGRKPKDSKAGVALRRAKQLLKFIRKGKQYTQQQLAEASGIPYRTVRRYIKILAENGLVGTSGKARGFRVYKI